MDIELLMLNLIKMLYQLTKLKQSEFYNKMHLSLMSFEEKLNPIKPIFDLKRLTKYTNLAGYHGNQTL